jgi:hypothetical protein
MARRHCCDRIPCTRGRPCLLLHQLVGNMVIHWSEHPKISSFDGHEVLNLEVVLFYPSFPQGTLLAVGIVEFGWQVCS